MLTKYLDWCARINLTLHTLSTWMSKGKHLDEKPRTGYQGIGKKKETPTVLVQKKADSHRKSLPTDKSEHYRYTIVFLSETTAYKCYGCDSAMQCPPAVQESPENIALTTMEHRSFSSDGKLQVKFQRAYYHVICHPIQKCFYWTSNFCRWWVMSWWES